MLHLRIVVETPSVCFRQSLLSCSNLRQRQTLLEEVHPLWLQPAHQTGHSGDHSLQVTDWMRMNTHGSARTHNSLTYSYSCGLVVLVDLTRSTCFFVSHIITFHHVELFNLEGFLQCKVFIHIHSIHSIHNKIYFSNSALQWHVFKISQEQQISAFCHIDEKFFLCF